MLNVQRKIHAEYNIVSIGTENSGSSGYMCITEILNGYRYLLPISHQIDIIEDLDDALYISAEISIEKIAISRFQLIPSLAFKNIVSLINNALIIGCGAIGITTYFELTRLNIKNIHISSRRQNIVKKYNNNLNIILYNEIIWDNYNTIIECTGEKNILSDIFQKAKFGTTIILLGTPRNASSINPLNIHRKNLKLMGGQEINGISQKQRQNCFNEIISYQNNYPINLSDIVLFHAMENHEYTQILDHKFEKPINIMKHTKFKKDCSNEISHEL